jgi:ribosomal protein S18 acetylase RimI-like enzyme
VARLHIDSWHATYTGLMPQSFLDRQTYEGRTDHWRRWAEANDGRRFILAAVAEDRIVGFVAGWPEPGAEGHIIEVAALHVAGSQHGRGLGRRLLTAAAVRGAELGYTALSLEMLEGNPAGGFYDRMGGRVDARYGAVFDGEAVSELRYRWDDIRSLTDLA